METCLTVEGHHKMNWIVFLWILAPTVFLINFITRDFGIYTMVTELQFYELLCVYVCVCFIFLQFLYNFMCFIFLILLLLFLFQEF